MAIDNERISTLRLYAQGFSYQQIASQLYLSIGAVNQRLRSLKRKYKAKDTEELCCILGIECVTDRRQGLKRTALNQRELAIANHMRLGYSPQESRGSLGIGYQQYRYATRRLQQHYGVKSNAQLKAKLLRTES